MICHIAGRWCYHHPVLGAMAQLVARLVRNEKVRGSNPLSSTIVVLHETSPNLICVLPSGRFSWRVFVLSWLWVAGVLCGLRRLVLGLGAVVAPTVAVIGKAVLRLGRAGREGQVQHCGRRCVDCGPV